MFTKRNQKSINRFYTIQSNNNLKLLIKKSISNSPSPSNHIWKLPKLNLLFTILLRDTKKDNSRSIFICLDLDKNEIINYEIVNGINKTKIFKEFIVNTLLSLIKENRFSNLFIPTLANSTNLIKFIKLISPKTIIEFFTNTSLTSYTELFKNFKENEKNAVITDYNTLKEFVDTYNNTHNNTRVLSIIKPKKDIGNRHYSTFKPIPENKKTNFNWQTYMSNIEHKVITGKEFGEEAIDFMAFVRKHNKDAQYIAVLPKIMLSEGIVRTIDKIKYTNINNFEELITLFSYTLERDDILSALSYDDHDSFTSNFPRGKIIWNYKIIENTSLIKNNTLPIVEDPFTVIHRKVKNIKDVLNYKGLPLKNTMDLTEWKGINFDHSFKTANFNIIVKNSKKEYNIQGLVAISDKSYQITFYLLEKSKLVKLFSVVDTLTNPQHLDTFKREYFEDDKLISTSYYDSSVLQCNAKNMKVSYIQKIKPDKKINLKKVCTLDLETKKTKSGSLIPICLSTAIDSKSDTFIFTDNWEEEMKEAFQTIATRKNRGKVFFVHNLSNFDSIFILDTLSKLGDVQIIRKDGKIFKIDFTYSTSDSKTKYKFHFMDSYQFLNASLKKLCICFNVEHSKILFPIFFPNSDSFNMEYIGAVPDIKYFPVGTTTKEYLEYCKKYENSEWNFKKELKKYCELDCISLQAVVREFAKQIFELCKLDINKVCTLPSLSFKDYRCNHMPENVVINITDNDSITFLKESFKGGYCDVFLPSGKNIRSYDVISQYPSVMHKRPMPVKSMTRVIGDPHLFMENPFGFFRVNVTAPDLHIPILPHRVKVGGSVRTIYPTGTWSGTYFSEEIKNAMKYGYKFEILEAILFESEVIFESCMEQKFNIKKSYEKDSPMYFISKLLMNSLYGRFGMDGSNEINVIVSQKESEEIFLKYKNVDCIVLPSKNVLVSYQDDTKKNNYNASIAISSAVTAYARIDMSEILVRYPYNIYAIDTDGVKMDVDLDPKYLSDTELGKMKHEYTAIKGIFIAPKVYGVLLKNPDTNDITEIVKVKGLKSHVPFEDLEKLLNKDHFQEYTHEKFYKELSLSTIIIKDVSYKLKVSSHKRVLVFNKNNKFTGTLPHKLDNGILVSDLYKIV